MCRLKRSWKNPKGTSGKSGIFSYASFRRIQFRVVVAKSAKKCGNLSETGKTSHLSQKKGHPEPLRTGRLFIVTPYMHCQGAPKGSFGTRHF